MQFKLTYHLSHLDSLRSPAMEQNLVLVNALYQKMPFHQSVVHLLWFVKVQLCEFDVDSDFRADDFRVRN